ncbi:MAG: alpha/beta fold hydrolase [Pseudomonadota bacterium]
MKRTRHTLSAHDGHALAAYCHAPSQTPRATLVIAPGMAIPQSFYADFANHLAEQGYRVWTFDYRGMGESRGTSLRACMADVSTWIEQDYDAVLRHAHSDGATLPLFVVGHSLGGQTAPLLPSAARIDGLVNIAVGSGAARHNQPPVRRRAPLLWYFLTPLLCPLFGYYPGRLIGIMGDIPRRAMYQWRRWCLTPDYLLTGEPGARAAYASARYPVLGLTFSDDELLLASGSRMMHEAYTGTEVDYRELSPQQFGLARIGHFGFFKPQYEKTLWPLVSQWLHARCAPRPA